MAKKKGLDLKLILTAVSVLLGIVALCMIFAPAAQTTVEVLGKKTTTTYSGLKLTFGYTESVLGVDVEVFKFSFMNLLTYILLLAGIVFGVLAALGKLGVLSRIISAACLIVSGVFFFLAVTLCVPASEVKELADAAKEALDLGIGSIIGGILSILAGVAVVVPVFLKK